MEECEDGFTKYLHVNETSLKQSSLNSPKKSPLREICINCGRRFGKDGTDKKLLPCALCKSCYCDKCLTWDSSQYQFTCARCRRKYINSPQKLLSSPRKSPAKSPTFDKSRKKSAKLEGKIRKQVEETVKKVLNTSLDQASTVPVIKQKKYGILFPKYHGMLSDAVENMSNSLHLCMLQQTKPSEILATNAKIELTDKVHDILDDAMVISTQGNDGNGTTNEEYNEDFNSQTYEELLATAVLNKVIDRCDDATVDPNMDTAQEHAGTDTDSGLSGSIRGDTLKGARQNLSEEHSEESLSSPCQSPKGSDAIFSKKMRVSPQSSVVNSDCDGSLEEHRHSKEYEWNGQDAAPVQFKIEEQIEEITTHHLTDNEEDNDQSSSEEIEEFSTEVFNSMNSVPSSSEEKRPQKRTIRKKKHSFRIAEYDEEVLPTLHVLPLADPRSITSARVPFPELGLDLIQESAATSHMEESEEHLRNLILDDNDWEENWLFRRQNIKYQNGRNTIEDPITMLIPNPSGHIGPTVGDRDVDELSEMSDRHSVCSYETWSGGESDEQEIIFQRNANASKELKDLVGEITIEFNQKDQEYTEDLCILDRLQINQKTSSNSIPNVENGKSNKKVNIKTSPPVIRTNVPSTSKSIMNKNNSSTSQVPPPPPLVAPFRIPSNKKVLRSASKSLWFENELQDLNVPEGKVLRLTCQVHARQKYGVSWYHRSEILKDGKTIFIWNKLNVYHLNVFNMSESEAGLYAVAAYIHSQCIWSFCNVTCLANDRGTKIPRVNLPLNDVSAEENSDIMLQCQVTGHPAPKVTFIKGGKPIVPKQNHCLIENDQYGMWNLHISNVTSEDGGQIKAVVSNTLGHAMTSCQVIIVPQGQLITRTQKDGSSSSVARIAKEQRDRIQQEKRFNKSVPISKSPSPSTIVNQNPFKSTEEQQKGVEEQQKGVEEQQKGVEEINKDSELITINGNQLFLPPKPGSIAEREHRKWLEAKPLENNPYSPEKLAHRLEKSNSTITTSNYSSLLEENSVDPSLRRGIPIVTDLSRYSRDYHISKEALHFNNNNTSIQDCCKLPIDGKLTNGGVGLVKIETQSCAHWKEELKDLSLNVGKKVADIQKTIDTYQREWKTRLHQKVSPNQSRDSIYLKSRNFSSSCINLSTPPKVKVSSSNRHVVYSSTEALNQPKKDPHQYLWRTVSVDTLDSNSKPTLPFYSRSSAIEVNNQHQTITGHYSNRSISRITSDSDDSSIIIPTINPTTSSNYHPSDTSSSTQKNYTESRKSHQKHYTDRKNHQRHFSDTEKWMHKKSQYSKMRPYYSENSADSMIEESDTDEEESLSTVGEMPNLPSVKELATKFDFQKRSSNYRPNHEIHHSLTARSVSRFFREGLKNQNNFDKNCTIIEQQREEHLHPPRNTPSPEHLGIPSSPASIPPRHFNPPGDTSDDSMVSNMMLAPRRAYRRKNVNPRPLDKKREVPIQTFN